MIRPFLGTAPVLPDSAFVAETAVVIGDVTLGPQASIWHHCTVRGDVNAITIGTASNIQDNSVVHVTHGTAPTVIGDYVTVGHGAIIHGCTIRDTVLIGMGATVMDHADIGTHSIVGAGALVTKNTQVPPRSLVLGQPATVVRTLSDEEVATIRPYADNYVRYSNLHAGRETPNANPFYDVDRSHP